MKPHGQTQVLEVLAIRHENIASNECLHGNAVLAICQVDTIILGHIFMIYGYNLKEPMGQLKPN